MSIREAQLEVQLFMEEVNQDVPLEPTIPSLAVQALRIKLHHEEAVKELEEAFAMCGEESDSNPLPVLTAIADSIADSLVVILGTAVACGIDIQPVFQEVMRSNMSKIPDGYEREDGKWVKGPNYSPADIAPIISQQTSA